MYGRAAWIIPDSVHFERFFHVLNLEFLTIETEFVSDLESFIVRHLVPRISVFFP